MKGVGVIVILCGSLLLNAAVLLYFGYKYYMRKANTYLWQQTTVETAYWQDKVSFYETLNEQSNREVFLVGDSMFDRLALQELWVDVEVHNRGIGYDNSKSLLQRLDRSVLQGLPRKIILFIGGNDISKRADVEGVIADVEKIIAVIKSHNIEICFVSLLPRGANYVSSQRSVDEINRDILIYNQTMARRCSEDGIVFVDVAKYFVTEQFFMDPQFTTDDIHLNAKGLVLLADLLLPYVATGD